MQILPFLKQEIARVINKIDVNIQLNTFYSYYIKITYIITQKMQIVYIIERKKNFVGAMVICKNIRKMS